MNEVQLNNMQGNVYQRQAQLSRMETLLTAQRQPVRQKGVDKAGKD